MKKPNFKNILLHAGYPEPVFEQFRTQIGLQNARMVETTSFIGSIMMLALTMAAFFVPSVAKVLPLYLTTACLFVAVYISGKLFKNAGSTTILVRNYIFLTAAFFFALGLDLIQRNPTATTVCVLLVALPLLIVDKPWREFLFFLAVTVCFMLESAFLKQSPKASIDVLNGASFLLVGSFLGYKHNQMVLRGILGQRQLERQRDTDALTNLYNKAALETKAQDHLASGKAEAALFVIDMDNFKFVNDTYGHHAGDEILAAIGGLLSALFRAEDLVCRFGGDEFVVFLPGAPEESLLRDRAERILADVAKVRITADADYRAHVCVGIARYPADGDSYEALFRCADTAMYNVKKRGKDGYGFYNAPARRKLLVVDDIEMNRAILTKILDAEYAVLDASDGASALQVLAQNPDTDMVITDLNMPGMNGEELIGHLRKDPRFARIAIIATTQHDDPRTEDRIVALGVDDFVYRAASPQVILLRVKNVLRAR